MARDFLTKECPKQRTKEIEKEVKGYDPETWSHMAELGWMGLVLPEEYGGSNANFMDLIVLFEEIGRNILPGPFFSTVALAAIPLMDFATEDQKAKYLPEIARGEKIWTLAINEISPDFDPSAIRTEATLENGKYVLNGEKMFVPYANVADYMLVVARTGSTGDPRKGLTLFIMDTTTPGIKIHSIPTLTGEKQCLVRFRQVAISKKDVLGKAGGAWTIMTQALDKASLIKCSEVSGACQAVLDMANAYAKERIQFGKPIGSFQVIQHKLAEMLMDVEGLQYLVYQAAWLTSIGAPCTDKIAMVKAKANYVYRRAALNGVKIHGAIGFSMDHDIGLYYRRVMATNFFPFGTDQSLDRVAECVGLGFGGSFELNCAIKMPLKF